MEANSPGQGAPSLLGNVELTFPGHPFESLDRALDPIPAVIVIGAAGGPDGQYCRPSA
jgi:hypothetical protein